MPVAALLALLAASPAVESALDAAAAPGVRAELVDLRPAPGRGCAPEIARALRAVTASGLVPLRVEGHDAGGAACQGWAWARVRVHAPALLASRDVREGEPLASAVVPGEAEVSPGRRPLAALPPGAVAARALPAGTPLYPAAVHAGPRPGDAVTVLFRAGAISVEQTGRAIPCVRGSACAVLPSGRRVEGRLAADGRIFLEVP